MLLSKYYWKFGIFAKLGEECKNALWAFATEQYVYCGPY